VRVSFSHARYRELANFENESDENIDIEDICDQSRITVINFRLHSNLLD